MSGPSVAPVSSGVQSSESPLSDRLLTGLTGMIDRSARSPHGGFARAASRFFLISRPFWTAAAHAPGFHYYDDTNGDSEAQLPNASATANATSSTVSANGSTDSISSGAASSEPHFRHTKLNSPALIPRASMRSSRKKKPLFTSPGTSPFLSQEAQPSMKPPQMSLDSPAAMPPIWSYTGIHKRVYNFFHLTPRRIAWGWSLLMLGLLIGCTYLHVLMSYCQRNMQTALGSRDQNKFYETLFTYMMAVMIASPMLSISQYAKNQLSLHWRIYLTNNILQKYFQHRNYYYLQAANRLGSGSSADDGHSSTTKRKAGSSTLDGIKRAKTASGSIRTKGSKLGIDNPDQRIADDIRAFTRSSLTFVNELLDELFQVIAFSGILYAISPMLVFGLIVYALFGTYLATAVFGLKLIDTNSKQSKLEADFRFSLVRVRTNAEAIAFYSGEHAELSYIYWRFSKIVRNLSRMAGLQCSLAFFKHAYGFLTILIPPFTLAPLYFRGEVELGVISQASMAFRQIFNSLNMVIGKMNELSKWRSGLERIWELEMGLERQDAAAAQYTAARRQSISDETKQAEQERIEREEKNEVAWLASPRPHASSDVNIQVRPSQHLHLDHLMVCVQGDPTEVNKASSTEAGVDSHLRVLVKNLTLFLPSLQQDDFSAGGAYRLQESLSPTLGRGLLIMGRSGIGKCFGAGTRVLLANGGTKAVEDIQVGDELIGDDKRVRRVLETHKGHTYADLHRYSLDPTLADAPPATYRVTFPTDTGLDAWTCNGGHILVLRMDPALSIAPSKDGGFVLKRWSLVGSTNSIQPIEQVISRRFHSHADAERHLQSTHANSSDILEWEVSVERFMCYDAELRARCRMFTVGDHATARKAHPTAFAIDRTAHAPYYGFQVSGNGRILLAGGLVSHNSTLLRAIAGLWKNGRGVIYRPNLSALLFLPQRPYMILGTLRQQLLYPFCPQTATSALTGVGRQGVLGALEEEHTNGDCDESTPSSPSSYGIRRRWPVGGKVSSILGSSGSPLSSPSPPPPSASDVTSFLGAEEGVPSDEDLDHILKLVNLAHLTKPKPNEKGEIIAGLDVLCDWSEVLSLGESQRIAFARILIHQPSYVFCDEITAALDAQNEEKLYSALSTYAPRTCLVSVGHRPALLKHHSHVLHLQEGGEWDLLAINEENQQEIERITAVTTTT